MAYKYVDREDIGGALKRSGADRVVIDSQDYENVLINELLDPHLKIDDQDMLTLAGADATGTVPPVYGTLTPLDNAVGVSVNISPIVSFDQAIIFSTTAKNFTLKKTSDNSVVEAWDVLTEQGSVAGKVEIVGQTVKMHLTAALAAATQYYIIWDAGAVTTLDGTPVAAQASTTAWSFTTA